MENQPLNEKLLKFAGFTYKSWITENTTKYWHDVSGDCKFRTPNLVNSLDAQSKYIYPKLQKDGYNISIIAYECYGFDCIITNCVRPNELRFNKKDNNSMSMAFALCCEKLIDSLEKK
jgi:hypothetical protein